MHSFFPREKMKRKLVSDVHVFIIIRCFFSRPFFSAANKEHPTGRTLIKGTIQRLQYFCEKISQTRFKRVGNQCPRN